MMNRKAIAKGMSILLMASMLVASLPAPLMAQEVASAAPQEASNTAPVDGAWSGSALEAEEQHDPAAEPYVIGEDVSLRDSAFKQFRMSDGSFTTVSYGTDVHYRADGEWQEIDNTLTMGNHGIVNAQSDVHYTFSTDSNQLPGVTANFDQYQVAFYGMQPTVIHEDETADIADIDEEASVGADGSHADSTDASLEQVTEGVSDSMQPAIESEPAQPDALPFDLAESESEDESQTEPIHENQIALDEDSQSTNEFEIKIINPAGATETAVYAARSVQQTDDESPCRLEKAAEVKGLASAVQYCNTKGAASYMYELRGRNLKESILVSEPASDYTYAFSLTLQNLTAELREDGGVYLLDGDESVFTIPAPYMYDANGAYSNDAAYTLTEVEDGAYVLTLQANAAWMNAEERAYPVVIDPTVFTSKSTSADNYIYTDYGADGDLVTTHQGEELFYGGRSIYNDMGNLYSYMKINNLPSLPFNTKFCKAWVSIPCAGYVDKGASSFHLFIQKALPNWRSQFTGTANESRILDYVTLSEESAGKFLELEISEAARDWYNGEANHGLVMYSKLTNGENMTDSAYAMVGFQGYINSSAAEYACPYLAVSYRNIQGIEDYYSYETAGAGRAGTAYVSDYVGNLTLLHTDVSDGGYSLAHVYNSNYGDRLFGTSGSTNQMIFHTVDYSHMIIGKGWKLNAQQSVVEYSVTNPNNETETYLIYTDDDGTEHYFYKNGTTYQDEDGLGLTITKSGSNYTMKDDKNNAKLFVHGYLTQITDANGNITAFVYNGKNYASGSTSWYPAQSGNQLTKIVQHNDGKTTYTAATLSYDSSYRLVSITDRYGKKTEYSVGSSNQLNKITEPDQTNLHYLYGGGNYRMSCAYDNESHVGLDFTYQPDKPAMTSMTSFSATAYNAARTVQSQVMLDVEAGQSKVTDCGLDGSYDTKGDNVTYTYVFDDFGRTVTVSCMDGDRNIINAAGGVYSEKRDTAKTNNRLVAEGSSGAVAQNILRNGDAESNRNWGNLQTQAGVYSNSYTTDQKKSGSRSVRLNLEDDTASSTVYQRVYIGIPGVHTLSAYIRTSDGYTVTDQSLAGARLQVEDDNNAPLSVIRQDIVKQKTPSEVNNGWQRITTVVNVNTAGYYYVRMVMARCRGTVYFDEIQLNRGEGESSYNFIENSDFTYGISDATNAVNASYSDNGSQHNNGYYADALVLQGEPHKTSVYSKVIPLTLSAAQAQNTTFLFSGWVSAGSIPTHDERTLQISLELQFANGKTQYAIGKFNDDVKGKWQYICIPVVPEHKEAVTSITVHCSYKHNCGYAYFTDLALLMEPCSTYTYNSDGKLTAVNATNQDEMQFAYDGADLISSSGGADGNFTYEYDSAHNIKKATNGSLSMSVNYDAAGHAVSTTLGNQNTLYMKTEAGYTTDGSKVASTKDELGNTTTYTETHSADGKTTTKVNTPVSTTGQEETSITYVNGYFKNYDPSNCQYYEDGWDIYTSWDDSYLYVRFESEELISDRTRYLDWYFDNSGIPYRMYARWEYETQSNYEIWFGRDDTGTALDKGRTQYTVNVQEGYAEFKVDLQAAGGIAAGDKIYLNRAYVWSPSWQMLASASINRTVIKEYDYVDSSPSGTVTTSTITDAAGRPVSSYVTDVVSVDSQYQNGLLTTVKRGGFINNGENKVQGAFADYYESSVVYKADGWRVFVQGGTDGYTYVRFENDELLSDRTRYIDWYFDNDGVPYRMYARWEYETQNNYEIWFGRDDTNEALDYKDTEYTVDVAHGYAEFKINSSIGGIQSYSGMNETGGFHLNRAYVWSPSWQILDSAMFDSEVQITYNIDSAGKKYQSYSFTYDLFGNCTKTMVGGRTLATNSYENHKLLSEVVYGNGSGVFYSYDALGRMESRDNLQWSESYAYDANGRIARLHAENGTQVRDIHYEYDTLGRLIYSVETNEEKEIVRYTATEYDSKNRVSQYSYLDGQEARTESYTYNEEDGTVKSYTVSNGDKIAVDYDALNRVSKKRVTLSGSSSPAYEVQVSYVDKSATQTTPLVKSVKYDYSANQDYLYGYEYDNIGNITRAYHQTASESVKNAGRYLYDEQNQLEYEEVYEDGSLYTLIYTYDTYGNIREVFKASGVGYDTVANVWMYGYPEKIGSYRYADDEGWADLLTEYNGYTLQYDEIGNPITYYSPKRNGYCYMNWNGRTLLGMTAGSDTISYTYDADGQRTGKKVGTDSYEYIYYGDKLISYVADGQYEMHFLYDETGSAYGFTYKSAEGNGTYYYVLNGQGDVVQLRNSAQEVVANYHYDAWGKLLSITNAAGQKITNTNSIAYQNPIRYRGYVYDEETGFYYLNSRYYDPQIKRFINADNQLTIGSDMSGLNLFAYCGNNPVNRIDPTGEAWWHWALGGVVVVGCAVATVVTAGGFVAAAGAVAAVGSGAAAATTASTVAAGAFIGSATVYGVSAATAASNSSSIKEFNDQGNWGTVASTAGGAVLGGGSAYVSTRTPTTKVYRSVSNAEAQDIKATGQFNLAPGGMESKQFGFNLAETRQFGNIMGQNTIVSARVPTNMLNQFYTGGVDTSIFRSGTLTVYGDQLADFNQAVGGTIKLMP